MSSTGRCRKRMGRACLLWPGISHIDLFPNRAENPFTHRLVLSLPGKSVSTKKLPVRAARSLVRGSRTTVAGVGLILSCRHDDCTKIETY
jgi:hypothetical protein